MNEEKKIYPLSRVYAVEVVRTSDVSQFIMVRVPQTGQLLSVNFTAPELFEAVSILKER